MSGEKIVHIIEDPAFRDRLCAADSFLGGLEDDLIGAAKLGARTIKAVDIDSVAVKVAKENAKLNGVEDKIDITCGNLADKVNGKYDIVIANIIADAVITLSADAAKFLKDDGIYITSGIIEHRIDDVKAALVRYGLTVIHIERDRDWAAIVCKKA